MSPILDFVPQLLVITCTLNDKSSSSSTGGLLSWQLANASTNNNKFDFIASSSDGN